jgi:pimeloyl-ACP methyl ester carboxylesterase
VIRHIPTPEGDQVAWLSRGTGPMLVFCNGIANNAYQWGNVLGRLNGRSTLVTWDYRGHGASSPASDPSCFDMDTTVDDLVRVLDAAAQERPDQQVTLVGYSLGVQVILEAWRRIPDRIQGLVCVLGTSGKPFDHFYGRRRGRMAHAFIRYIPARVLTGIWRSGGPIAPLAFEVSRLMGTFEEGMQYEDLAPWFEHLTRMDGASFKALALSAQSRSAEDVLPSIDVPTLIVSGGADAFSPPQVSRKMHEQIADSSFRFFAEATHTGLVGCAEPIGSAVEQFLVEHGLVG